MTIAVRIENVDAGGRDLQVGYCDKKGKNREPVQTLGWQEGVILHVYDKRDIYVEEVEASE